MHRINTNSNDIRYLKEVSPSARFAPADESTAKFYRTRLTALNMSTRAEIEPKCEPHLVSPGRLNVRI
jgi:hypothetical protein